MPETGLLSMIPILSRGVYSKTHGADAPWLFYLSAFASKLATLPKKKAHASAWVFVPETGFEPAHPFGRYHLKVVRLPISPPGQRIGIFVL